METDRLKPARYPKWSELEPFLEVPRESTFSIDGTPNARIVVNGIKKALQFFVECSDDRVADPLAEIEYTTTTLDGSTFLVLTTKRGAHARNLYDLAIEVADAVQLDEVPVPEAIQAATAKWKQFLRGPNHLSPEAETGLVGELWLLRRLIASMGDEAAMKCWAGPVGGDHDFLLHDVHIEVKSTRGNQRKHLIDRVDQLEPSADSPLYLLSFHFQVGGLSGDSLKALIASIETIMSSRTKVEFRKVLLDTHKLDDDVINNHDDKFEMRSPPSLITIDDEFPRLARKDLEGLSAWKTGRLQDVSFVVDVTGMGDPEGSPEFERIVPNP